MLAKALFITYIIYFVLEGIYGTVSAKSRLSGKISINDLSFWIFLIVLYGLYSYFETIGLFIDKI